MVVHPIAVARLGKSCDCPHVAVGQAFTAEGNAERLLHLSELLLAHPSLVLREVVQVLGEAGIGVGHAPCQARLGEVLRDMGLKGQTKTDCDRQGHVWAHRQDTWWTGNDTPTKTDIKKDSKRRTETDTDRLRQTRDSRDGHAKRLNPVPSTASGCARATTFWQLMHTFVPDEPLTQQMSFSARSSSKKAPKPALMCIVPRGQATRTPSRSMLWLSPSPQKIERMRATMADTPPGIALTCSWVTVQKSCQPMSDERNQSG